MPRVMQPSFAAGEITPALHSSVDTAEYRRGLALAENFFVSIYGGLLSRSGTRFVNEVPDRSRLLPFQLGENDGYAVEVGSGGMRFYTQGGRLVVQGTDAVIGAVVGEAAGQWNNRSTGSATIAAGSQLAFADSDLGTPFGNITGGGGIAAAFDGDTGQFAAQAAYVQSFGGELGLTWPAPRQVVGFRVYGTSDLGLTGKPQTVTLLLQGSNSGFTTDIADLGEWVVSDQPGLVVDRFSDVAAFTTFPSFTSHRVVFIAATRSPGNEELSVAEVQFFERDPSVPSLSLIGGTGGSIAIAEQRIVTSFPGREHVFRCFIPNDEVSVQVGHAPGTDSSLKRTFLPPGWCTFAFTPAVSPFFLQFFNTGGGTRNIESLSFHPAGDLVLSQPFTDDDAAEIRFTQDANILTLTHPRFPVLELTRGPAALTWFLSFKRYGPGVGPTPDLLTAQKLGSGSAAVTHAYVVTYISATGQESLPSAAFGAQGVANLSGTDYIRISIAQPLPADVVACNVYKLLGGTYGLMGLCVATFDDVGQVPKTDQPPPQFRDPFATSFPTSCTYWEQRLALAGSEDAPETVELSKPARRHDFGRSSPPRDDDAITFTPAGPRVRRIRHMLASQDLALFTDAAVLIARRGESALTPALEGGVKEVLARGIGTVRPMLIDSAFCFVGIDGQAVRLLDADYQETELSLAGEHLFRGRRVVDWAYQEVPWSLLWLAMSDGEMVTLSLLPRQGVIGWARAKTEGLVESVCVVRERGQDRLYLRCRRWLRGAWRNTVELLGERKLSDIRDAYHVDCGLSYDTPRMVVDLQLTNPGRFQASNTGLVVGDKVDLDETGIEALDDQRFTVTAVSGSTITVDRDWSGLGPWRGGGVARRCVSSITGLGHLEGSTVAVLNTGNVEEPKVVTGGAVALSNPGSRVHVGLAYEAKGQTLNIALPAEGFNRRKAVREVQILTRDTRGIEFGPDFVRMDRPKARDAEAFGEPVGLKVQTHEITVQAKWGLGGRVCFRQAQPLPAEILSVTPVFEGSTG